MTSFLYTSEAILFVFMSDCAFVPLQNHEHRFKLLLSNCRVCIPLLIMFACKQNHGNKVRQNSNWSHTFRSAIKDYSLVKSHSAIYDYNDAHCHLVSFSKFSLGILMNSGASALVALLAREPRNDLNPY